MPTYKTIGEFNWYEDESIIARTSMGIAVYQNDRGEIVVRQEREASWQDDDPFIVIQPAIAVKVAQAILEQAGLSYPPFGAENQASGAPKDRTAAERQRRHRQNQRDNQNGVTETVTPSGRDSERDTGDLLRDAAE